MIDIADLADWKTEKLADALDVVLDADDAELIEVATVRGANLWSASELVDLLNRIAGEIETRVEKARQAVPVVN